MNWLFSLWRDRVAIGVASIVLLGVLLQTALILAFQFLFLGREDDLTELLVAIEWGWIGIFFASFFLIGIPFQKAVMFIVRSRGLRLRRVLGCMAEPMAITLSFLALQTVSLTFEGLTWEAAWTETMDVVPEVVGLCLAFLFLPTLGAIVWAVGQDKATVRPSVDQVFG